MLFIPYLYCCKSPVAEQPEEDVEKELRPTLHSEDVKTLISDSGVTKYRITAKVWEVFDKTVSPYWYFPEKIYVEKFDSLYNTDRKSVVQGKSVKIRIDLGGRRMYNKKNSCNTLHHVSISTL